MKNRLLAFLTRHRTLTFVVMGLSFFLFGVMSLNLFMLLKANLDLYLDYGSMVIGEGALLQLVQLLLYGYLSLAFYVIFKACEQILVRWMITPDVPDEADKARQ